MNHTSSEVLLDLALETLPQAEVDSARAHLEECDACAEAFARLGEEQKVLGKVLEATVTPPALGVKIRASVAREPTPKPRLRRAMIAAAAMLAFTAAWFVATTPDPQPEIKRAMIQQMIESERLALGLDGGK